MAETFTDMLLGLMKKPERIRNIAICAHIDHGKTTLSGNLMNAAGMISEKANFGISTSVHKDEQERGITIDSANVSMIHKIGDTDYLINLIDTPGHVDFGGDVTRAMRAVDGAIVVCCASEGIMPQTETVLRQALKEKVKPILFINKVDRLIKEQKLSGEMIQERFVKIITKLNDLIEKIAPPEYKQKWKVNVADGSVVFGSAYSKWAVSIPYMQKKNFKLGDVIKTYQDADEEKIKKLPEIAPLFEVLLDSVVKHLPNPIDAQKYRIPHIWPGDIESKEGKDILNCNTSGELAFVVTKIVKDPNAGLISTGRIFSGTMRRGIEVVTSGGEKGRLQQVFVSKLNQRLQIEEVVSGNIAGVTGLKDIVVGMTVSSKAITPFEQIQHIFEPVVTVAVEPAKPADLPKLVETLKVVGKEDPSLKITINEETGEFLISGMGELHLDVVTSRIKSEKGMEIKVSPPIVVFRESATSLSSVVEGKSPNKHNKFYITIEPLEDEFYKAIANGEVPEGRVKKKDRAYWDLLVSKGLSKEEAERVKDIYKSNVFIDMTKGVIALNEVIELVLDAFEEIMRGGPLAREGCVKLKLKLVDITLHEDSIHRGPGQVYPAVRDAVKEAMLKASPVLFEPVQVMQMDCPQDVMGNVATLANNRRGQVLDMKTEEDNVEITAKIPVAESFGLTGDFRSATGGRGAFFVKSQMFELLPRELQEDIIKKIRTRKGLSENQ